MRLSPGAALQSGKYRIIRVLGQGGFGITYLAENVLLDKKVAVKEFFPKDFCGRDATSHVTLGTQNNAETVTKLRERFLKEAKNIARLDHPGIVRIHDIFEENSTAYYVMDYIEGESLNEIVKRDGPLPEGKAVEYICKIGEALEYMHSRNMTHFDVKPANIVVRKSDDRPILIDFGLSKQYDAEGDATSTLMQGVSQGYSPIELYNIGAITSFSPQTDVYSLGATLYFLVTGKVPPTASQIIDEGLTFRNDISLRVQGAILKAMESGRTRRTQSVADFLKMLSANSDDEDTHIIGEDTVVIDDKKPKEPEQRKERSNLMQSIFIPLGLIAIACVILFKFCESGSDEPVDYDTSYVVEEYVPAEEVVDSWYGYDTCVVDSIW